MSKLSTLFFVLFSCLLLSGAPHLTGADHDSGGVSPGAR